MQMEYGFNFNVTFFDESSNQMLQTFTDTKTSVVPTMIKVLKNLQDQSGLETDESDAAVQTKNNGLQACKQLRKAIKNDVPSATCFQSDMPSKKKLQRTQHQNLPRLRVSSRLLVKKEKTQIVKNDQDFCRSQINRSPNTAVGPVQARPILH